MEKPSMEKQTNTTSNKKTSVILMLLILVFSNYFTPKYTHDYFDNLIFSTPIFTIIYLGYLKFYGLKEQWEKIILVIAIIGSALSLWTIWFATHFMSGRN